MHKSVPKVTKVLTFGKVSQKIQKSWGGARPVLDEVQIKAAFILGASLGVSNTCKLSMKKKIGF